MGKALLAIPKSYKLVRRAEYRGTEARFSLERATSADYATAAADKCRKADDPRHNQNRSLIVAPPPGVSEIPIIPL